MNRQHVKDTKNGSTYEFSTEANAIVYGLDEDISTIIVFLYTQTVYFNSLHSYNEINMQYAAENLVLTRLGMKAGIHIWGEKEWILSLKR